MNNNEIYQYCPLRGAELRRIAFANHKCANENCNQVYSSAADEEIWDDGVYVKSVLTHYVKREEYAR